MKQIKITKKKNKLEKNKLVLQLVNLFKIDKPFTKKEIDILAYILTEKKVDVDDIVANFDIKKTAVATQLSNLRKKSALDINNNIAKDLMDLDGSLNFQIYVIQDE